MRDAALRERLEKLVGLLASDIDGEALAAARALNRLAAAEGLPLIALLAALAPPVPAPPAILSRAEVRRRARARARQETRS
jgi:hypothetical protein